MWHDARRSLTNARRVPRLFFGKLYWWRRGCWTAPPTPAELSSIEPGDAVRIYHTLASEEFWVCVSALEDGIVYGIIVVGAPPPWPVGIPWPVGMQICFPLDRVYDILNPNRPRS